MRLSFLALVAAVAACLTLNVSSPSPAAAQSGAAPPGGALPLSARVEAEGLAGETLRTHLEQELGVRVELADAPAGPHLVVEAATLTAVRVAFVRDDGATVERTVDVSAAGAHAAATVALLASNLVRDEAGELLATLESTAAETEPSAPEAPTESDSPAPPPTPPATPPAPAPPPAAETQHAGADRAPTERRPRGCDPNGLRHVPVGADFLPYVGTSLVHGTEVERMLSFNLIGGFTGAVRGFELAGVFNLESDAVCGVQMSGITNLVGGPVQGAQLGLVNGARGRLDGAQLGLVGLANGPVAGAQLGLANLALGDTTGAQLGLTNLALGDTAGAQLGLFNLAEGELDGAQVGLVNLGVDETRGAQLGLLNVGVRRVRGAMLGLVNVAEDADAPIGIVSVLWKGRTHLDVWGTDAGLLLVGVVHGGRRLHNIYGVGAGVRGGDPVLVSAWGIGGRLFDGADLWIDLDYVGYGMFAQDSNKSGVDVAWINQARLVFAYRLAPTLALFASPALNVSIADGADNPLRDPSAYGSFRLSSSDASTTVRLWPGFTLGTRFF